MTDYNVLARELMEQMLGRHKIKPFKDIDENLHGGAFVLHFVWHKKEVLPKEISDAMGVSSARVAVALNDLEEKGLITREIDTSDRRKIIVRPTKLGAEIAAEKTENILRKTECMLKSLGEDDARALVRIIGRLAEKLELMGN